MTSTASNPVASNTNQQSAPSYASAASATKKSAVAPLIATGTHSPVVGSTPQHGKPPMNGRPPITPAVPTVAPTPTLVHGSSNTNINSTNGAPNTHIRNSSVTIKAPGGPSSFNHPNGGNMAGPKPNMPQFGFASDSPVVAHSTPQPSSAAPIAIPSVNNNRVPSPAHSPQPIPMTSGGNAPGGLQPGGPKPVFGSHRNDEGERLMRQNMGQPMNTQNPHGRKDSHHSMHDPNMPNQSGRGGYQQHGRGGRNFYTQGPQPMYNQGGYNGGRGGPAPRGGGGMGASPFARHSVPNFNAAQSPRMPPGSPAMVNVPAHTASPSMPPAVPYQHQYHGGASPYQQMPQPMGQHPQYTGYAVQGGYPMPGYNNYQMQPQMGYHNQPPQQQVTPGFAPTAQPFTPGAGQFNPAGGAPAMSRNNSALSHQDNRPGSSGPPLPPPQGNGPVIASGSHPNMTQAKAPVVSGASSANFIRPKKSAAIVIKNDLGQALDLSHIKSPTGVAPSPVMMPSKTSPVQTATTTPEPKPASTPAESNAPAKTADERKKEFQDAVKAMAIKDEKEDAEAKAKAEAEEKAEAEAEEKAKAEADAKAAADARAKEEADAKAAAEANAKEEADAKAREQAAAKAKEEADAKAKDEADAKAKEEAEAAKKAEAEKAAAAAPKAKPTLKELETKDFATLTAEEQDLYFSLIDEQDAKREAEQAKISEIKDAKERAKNAPVDDKKLREQEAEAERLDLEKEQKRKQREARGEQIDVAAALKAKIDNLKTAEPSVPAVTNKMAGLGLGKHLVGAKGGLQKQKPAALNLQPIKTSVIEAPQPSAALQSLKSARFLQVMTQDIYPEGIKSPNPAVSSAARTKTAPFRYDMNFMLQFQGACKEAPSIDFQKQVKTLIGEEGGNRSATAKTPAGSGRQNPRSGTGGSGAMGSFFGAPGPIGRTLPAGTSSEQRFAMSTMGSRPAPANPVGSFNRPGFPGGASMSRNPSSTGGMVPNSPRTSSRRGGGSKRNDSHATKFDGKANASMPLTQGMDLKPIAVSSSGWKPMSLSKKTAAPTTENGLMDPETVQRKVKAALNKMTPEKFERLSEQVIVIANQSKHESDGRTLRQVIQLIFEKATDEAHWSSMYAKFCHKMLVTMGNDIHDDNILDKSGIVVYGGALFRKYLLNRCQEEFETGWQSNLPQPKDGEGGKSKEAQLLSDEYYVAAAAKRRGLGLVQFIGELYKLGMLTERIMHECLHKLLDYDLPDEAEIESLCKLLRTIGATVDSTEKGHKMMSAYFDRMNNLLQKDLPSRMKFMLMDVVDLRKKNWSSAENKGPKTLEEVRVEAEAALAAKQAEQARNNQRGGRPQGGRGDTRSNFTPHYNPPVHQLAAEELRGLRSVSRTSTNTMHTLGPSTMMQSRSNSGRRTGPSGAFSRGTDNGLTRRTTTPVQMQRQSTNPYHILESHQQEDALSPPSAAASPNTAKAAPASLVNKKSG